MIDSAGLYRASEPLQASTQVNTKTTTPNGGNILLSDQNDVAASPDSNLDIGPSQLKSEMINQEYVDLQRRIYRLILVLALISASISFIVFDSFFAISLLIGSLSGLLYLRLLARSIGKLGETSKTINKVQLIVPVLMILLVFKLPQLELLPALLGFLLYKPSLIIQFLIQPSIKG